jgi:hypothetical protein
MTENPNNQAPLHDEDLEGHRQGLEGTEDLEGHGLSSIEGDDEDVEGHRNRPDRNRPDRNRPDFMADRNRPDLLEDDDVEGHRIIGSNVQPPRDADLGGTEH